MGHPEIKVDGCGLFCAGEEADVAGGFVGEVERGGGTAYAYRVALDGGFSSDTELRAGFDAAGLEVPQGGDISVGDAFDDKGSFLLDIGEKDGVLLGHLAFQGGDGVAVGVDARVAQLGGDALLEALGDEVLEALGFFVDLFDGVIKDLVEEGFDEAVVTEDFERSAFAGGGELDAAMALVFHEGCGGGRQFLQHVGDGGGGDAEVVGERGAGDPAMFRTAQ